MDLSGKYIAEIPITTGQKHISWNCGHLANGVYFYQTQINGEVYRGKIVVN
jgi:hypothetical protein